MTVHPDEWRSGAAGAGGTLENSRRETARKAPTSDSMGRGGGGCGEKAGQRRGKGGGGMNPGGMEQEGANDMVGARPWLARREGAVR